MSQYVLDLPNGIQANSSQTAPLSLGAPGNMPAGPSNIGSAEDAVRSTTDALEQARPSLSIVGLSIY